MRISLLFKGLPEIELVVDIPRNPQNQNDEGEFANKVAETFTIFDNIVGRIGSDVRAVPQKLARYLFESGQKYEKVGLLAVILRTKGYPFPEYAEVSLIYNPLDVGLTLSSAIIARQVQEATELAKRAGVEAQAKMAQGPPKDQLERKEGIRIQNSGVS